MDRFLDPIWMQRNLDALRETLDVDPAMRRDMIQFLFDEGLWDRETLSWSGAEARFAGCLNPSKQVFFKFSEILALMKRFRRYALLYAICEDLGFERPRQKPTEERRQELMQRLVDTEQKLLDELTAGRAELARLDEAPNVHLHPAIKEGRGSFSQQDPAARDAGHGKGGF